MLIKCHDDCFALQSLVDKFTDWCTINFLTLSVHKCNVISFHRKLKPIEYDYTITNQKLERVDNIRDLGILLDTSLTFRMHLNEIVSKANQRLGFIFKICDEFKDPFCLRSLYCTLVRSLLESNVVVWCPYQLTWTRRIEAIQRKFVRRALRSLPWRDPSNLPPYEHRCSLLQLDTLETRRFVAQVVFTAKILLGVTDAPELLSRLNMYAPERILRQRDFLYNEPRNTIYGSHDPLRAMSVNFNEVFAAFDFNSSVSSFQRMVTEHCQVRSSPI